MRTEQFVGDRGGSAASDVLRYACQTLDTDLRGGQGLLLCGQTGGLLSFLAVELASVPASGALVHQFTAAPVDSCLRAQENGLPAILWTAMNPGAVVSLVWRGELTENGWPEGEPGIEALRRIVPRVVDLRYDSPANRYLVTTGTVEDFLSSNQVLRDDRRGMITETAGNEPVTMG